MPKILVIRRDNIGDLVCTTPMLAALRRHFPDGYIAALVNSYNAAVLAGNPDIDDLYVYTKLKHRHAHQSAVSALFDRIGMYLRLRRERFDYVIVPGMQVDRAVKFARSLRPGRILTRSVGESTDGGAGKAQVHEVEAAFRLLAALGVNGDPPPVRVFPQSEDVTKARWKIDRAGAGVPELIGIQISSRKPVNRWPAEKYIKLIESLHATYGFRFLLLWSPGSRLNPRHPGDDETATSIVEALQGLPVTAHPQGDLSQLIAELSLCRAVITSDGGAMHLAAALGKPMVCFFGDADPVRWRPWRTPHVLLRPSSRVVSDITEEEARIAFAEVLAMPASA